MSEFANAGSNRIFGFDMNQNRMAVPVWDYAFDAHPPARVIELGSYNGGFTMALAFSLLVRQGSPQVYSFDVMQAPKEEWAGIARTLPVVFVTRDIWTEVEGIGRLIQSEGTSYLLCDGGDKPKEFKTFAPYLKKGDVIAAHDFKTRWWDWSEIKLEDVADTVSQYGLKRWLPDEMDLAGWLAYIKL